MKRLILLPGLLSNEERFTSVSKWEPSDGGCISSVVDRIQENDVLLLVTNHKIKFYPRTTSGLLSSGSIIVGPKDDPFKKAIGFLKAIFGFDVDENKLIAMEIDEEMVKTPVAEVDEIPA